MTDIRADAFLALLAHHARIVIIGGPLTGKTTLAKLVKDRIVLHTDGFSHHAWEDIPRLVIAHCAKHERFVLDGCVQAARALRKGLSVDAVVYLDEPMQTRSKHQIAAAKSVGTIFSDWRALDMLTPVHSLDIIQ